MRLVIKRNQADVKGMFGGHKGVAFSLHSRAEVTSEERALIDRYKVGEVTLATYQLMHRGQPLDMSYTVSEMINGKTTELGDIASLLALEESIKSGCQNLKSLLLVMSTFGGEEVIDI